MNTTFAPYLSKALLHRIDVNDACQDDWARQHPDPNSKPPFLESGLFSGGDNEAYPRAFHIEKAQTEKDGSFRVYVALTGGIPPDKPSHWHVIALVVQKTGHYVVDDVIYVNDGWRNAAESRLSKYLSQDCDGPHWVGDREH
jgi:hypothetical protein